MSLAPKPGLKCPRGTKGGRMTLWNYILGRFLSRVISITVMTFSLVALLTVIENLRRTAKAGEGFAFAAKLTLLQTPSIMSQVFPLVLMLAALWTFLGFSRTSELVVLRAAGVSAMRFLMYPVLGAMALGIFAILVFNPIVATTSEMASNMRDSLSRGGSNVLSLSENSLWLRQGTDDGQTVIQARRVSANGTVLFGVRLHQFDLENRLITRIEASSASLRNASWVLRGVRRWNVNPEGTTSLGEAEQIVQLSIPTNLDSSQILDSFAAPETVSFWKLSSFIKELEQAGFSARRHRLFFHTELARPALFAAMVLIGAGFSLRHVRFGRAGVMVMLAVLSGFMLYFFKDLSESLGNTGAIPLLLAAWSPPGVAILFAMGLLLHLEDG